MRPREAATPSRAERAAAATAADSARAPATAAEGAAATAAAAGGPMALDESKEHHFRRDHGSEKRSMGALGMGWVCQASSAFSEYVTIAEVPRVWTFFFLYCRCFRCLTRKCFQAT